MFAASKPESDWDYVIWYTMKKILYSLCLIPQPLIRLAYYYFSISVSAMLSTTKVHVAYKKQLTERKKKLLSIMLKITNCLFTIYLWFQVSPFPLTCAGENNLNDVAVKWNLTATSYISHWNCFPFPKDIAFTLEWSLSTLCPRPRCRFLSLETILIFVDHCDSQ